MRPGPLLPRLLVITAALAALIPVALWVEWVVVGAFVLVDMRDVAEAVTPVACSVLTESVSTYLHVLDIAAAHGILAADVHQLSIDALVNRWAEDDPRWEVLIAAG